MKIVTSLLLSLLTSVAIGQKQHWLSYQACQQLDSLYRYHSVTNPDLDVSEKLYLKGYASFMQFLNGESHECIQDLEEVIDSLETIESKKDIRKELMLVNLNVQLGLMKLVKGDEFAGVYGVYSAYQSFYDLSIEECNRLEYQKLDALFTIFASQVQDQSGVMSWLLGIKGNESLGFQNLKAYVDEVQTQVGLNVESLVLYAYLQLKFGQWDVSELEDLIDIADRIQSPLLAFVMGLNGLKELKSEKVVAMCKTVKESSFESFPLLNYIKGRALLNMMDRDGCDALTKFNVSFKGISYKVDATYRLARYWHCIGNFAARDSLFAYLTNVKEYPTSLDKQALSEATSLANSPIALCKSRFYFDGGDYQKSKDVLLEDKENKYPIYYQIERNYRLGRIEDCLGHQNNALLEYEKVVELSGNDIRYFGPYAALFMTKYYLQEGELSKAAITLEKARILNNGEYKSDISREIKELQKSIAN